MMQRLGVQNTDICDLIATDKCSIAFVERRSTFEAPTSKVYFCLDLQSQSHMQLRNMTEVTFVHLEREVSSFSNGSQSAQQRVCGKRMKMFQSLEYWGDARHVHLFFSDQGSPIALKHFISAL